MAYIIDQGHCSYCEKCIDQCPMEAVKLDSNGRLYIDADQCTDCGSCMDMCPEGAVRGGL